MQINTSLEKVMQHRTNKQTNMKQLLTRNTMYNLWSYQNFKFKISKFQVSLKESVLTETRPVEERHDIGNALPALVYHRNECSIRLCKVTENINEDVKSSSIVLKAWCLCYFQLEGKNTRIYQWAYCFFWWISLLWWKAWYYTEIGVGAAPKNTDVNGILYICSSGFVNQVKWQINHR